MHLRQINNMLMQIYCVANNKSIEKSLGSWKNLWCCKQHNFTQNCVQIHLEQYNSQTIHPLRNH